MKKILLTSLLSCSCFFLFIVFFSNDFITYGIKKINQKSNFFISFENLNFSFPAEIVFKNLRITHKKFPFYVVFDKFSSSLLLKNLLALGLKVKSSGELYDGILNSTFWKSVRSRMIRGDLFIKDLNISRYPLLQMFPIEGGIFNLNGFNFAFDENNNIHYLSGDANLKNFKIKEPIKLSKEISMLPIDIKIPSIEIKEIFLNYKFKEKILYIDDLKFDSNLLKLSSSCYVNFSTNSFQTCLLNFNFSDDGWKEFKNWIFLLTQGKIKEHENFSIELQKNIYSPKIVVKNYEIYSTLNL